MIKKTLIVVLVIVALTFTAVMPSLSEQKIFDFSGSWIVRWLDNDTRNPISLTQINERLNGTYTNDKKETCSISGQLVQKNNHITLRVDCPQWDIVMDGVPSSDGNTIKGIYIAYGTSKGDFEMTRK